jgi:hypothetical protein
VRARIIRSRKKDQFSKPNAPLPSPASAVLHEVDLDDSTCFGRGHSRLKQLEYLLKAGQLDKK